MGYDNSCPCKKWQCLKWCQWKYESNFMKVSICFCTYGTMQHMHNISSRVLTFLAWSVIVESFSHFLSALTLKHAIVYYSSVCVSVVRPTKKAHTFCNIISKHSLTTTRCKEKPKKTRFSILFPVQTAASAVTQLSITLRSRPLTDDDHETGRTECYQ